MRVESEGAEAVLLVRTDLRKGVYPGGVLVQRVVKRQSEVEGAVLYRVEGWSEEVSRAVVHCASFCLHSVRGRDWRR